MSGGEHDFARVVDIADTLFEWEDALNEALGEADMYDEREAFNRGRITLRDIRAIARVKEIRARDGVYGDVSMRVGESVEDACARTLKEHWMEHRGSAEEEEDDEEGEK